MNFEEAYKKASKLVAKMTAEEKMSQLLFDSPAIERLGINEYNWWNEALHGVARAGTATVFPQAIGLAATFNPPLVKKIAGAISTEARAKYNKNTEYGDRDIYKGLTYWSPNINIMRDPRWGRGQETYGEDPFLTARIARSFIEGIQGDGEFMKACACAKHFAAHSGPEELRHGFSSEVTEKDLNETYLPAFEKSVEAGVAGVMGAYSALNGVPCCANEELIENILRKKWNFKGYFVSDCGAINDVYEHHKFASSPEEAAAVSLNAGCDLNCGDCYSHMPDAYEEDLVTDEAITKACERLFAIRYMLGEFEESRPYSDIGFETVDCALHRELNIEAARESIVLLKNENGFLPLRNSAVKSIAVVGPNAMSVEALEGNYEGKSSEYITVADGIRRMFPGADIRVAAGSQYKIYKENSWDGHENMISDGMAAASVSDVTVLCLGLSPSIEGECSDKEDIMLPEVQRRLAEKVCEVCDNIIVVLMCGSAIDIGDKLRSNAKAIIWAGYPGARGGLAAAEIISGAVSPCGRLPFTYYSSENELPDFTDYSMKGRTYRYFEGKPLYPFGFGLGYSDIKYEGARKVSENDDSIIISVKLKNSGIKAKEKIQIYAAIKDSRTETPIKQLCAVAAAELESGESAEVTCEVEKYWLQAVLEDGSRVDADGGYTLYLGIPKAGPQGSTMEFVKI